MEFQRRPFLIDELNVVVTKLIEQRDTAGSDIMQLASPQLVWERLKDMGDNRQVLIAYDKDTFIGIVVFDAGKPWWSYENILTELLVLCVSPKFKGFSRLAISQLEEIAKLYNCKAIAGGALFRRQPKLMINAYMKQGFELSPMCVKMVK